VVGGIIFTEAGVRGALLLALFFVSGSLLTYAGRSNTAGAAPVGHSAGRTAWQVFANGTWAAGGSVLAGLGLETGWVILAAALAAAQADTWATEIGSRSAAPVRLITSGRTVPAGTSGGVTVLGTLGGIAGAVALAGLALGIGVDGATAAAALVGGVAGMLIDSLLGASLQGVYYCDTCIRETERATHECGRPARRVRGVTWLDNDGVNLVATGVGAAGAVAIAALI
jgi:uncharacterized protein (TIGR00297 family)